MLWQPQILPGSIGTLSLRRPAQTEPSQTTRLHPRALPIGKMVHLGGATGSVFVEARLAQTPTATIYAVASQTYKGRHVLKCVDLHETSREQIGREVNLQRQAAGRFVIEVHAPTFAFGQAFFLLERGAGGTVEHALAHALAQRAPIAVSTVLQWFADMVAAVHQCHIRGIVHRDIKPDNMVLTAGSQPAHMRVKLTDFGLATTFTDPPHAVGTITYMAPEVLRNQGATTAADLWSLGVTLYRMLVGIEPYYDDSAEATALRLLRHTPQFTQQDLNDTLEARGVAADLRGRIVAVVESLLDPNPRTRMHLGALLASPLA